MDAIVVGGGHNGLVCAFYLARAGLKVTVLERRDVVGGAAVTEEFHPGFRNSTASYTVSLLNPRVIADMDLPRHGLRVVERKVANFLPIDDRNYLLTGGDRTAAEVAPFSSRDAERLGAYEQRLDAIADVLRDLVLETPPNVGSGGFLAALPEMLKGAGLARRLGRLDETGRRDLLALFSQSAGDWLDGWFESDPIKAVLGFDGVVGNYASPYTPGVGLCAAAPRLRRGERPQGRLGPRDRRHGRDHPGDGRRLRGTRRGDRDRRGGRGGDRRGRAGSRGRHATAAPCGGPGSSSPTSIRSSCSESWSIAPSCRATSASGSTAIAAARAPSA